MLWGDGGVGVSLYMCVSGGTITLCAPKSNNRYANHHAAKFRYRVGKKQKQLHLLFLSSNPFVKKDTNGGNIQLQPHCPKTFQTKFTLL